MDGHAENMVAAIRFAFGSVVFVSRPRLALLLPRITYLAPRRVDVTEN